MSVTAIRGFRVLRDYEVSIVSGGVDWSQPEFNLLDQGLLAMPEFETNLQGNFEDHLPPDYSDQLSDREKLFYESVRGLATLFTPLGADGLATLATIIRNGLMELVSLENKQATNEAIDRVAKELAEAILANDSSAPNPASNPLEIFRSFMMMPNTPDYN